jgi:predicted dehydrogenase
MKSSRREFIRTATVSSMAAAPAVLKGRTAGLEMPPEIEEYSANDKIRVATIGMGIIGFQDTSTALKVPGVELVAVADCYEGRLQRAKEVYGSHIRVTKDYLEVLERSDVDAIIISTPDHWHQQISIDAMKAGKAVYCEKPMVQKIEQGEAIIRTQEETRQPFQVGSQVISNALTKKARELYEEGAIGELNMVDILISRNTPFGAWNYSIPTDASPSTIDWHTFLGSAPKRPFDADRFFRWRKYWDYGTGVAGDMYVHRFTALHQIIGSKGPVRAMATGGIYYWKDREVPDLILALYEYPETKSHPTFTLSLGANFKDSGHGSSFQLIGSEGTLTIGARLKLTRRGIRDHTFEETVKGYNSFGTFSKAQQEAFIEQYNKVHLGSAGPDQPRVDVVREFRAPRGHDSRLEHFKTLFRAMRNGGVVNEGPKVGLRAAAPALMANLCHRNRRIYEWDPENMKLKV